MKNNRGFSLVELIVSIALLALILVPISSFFTNSFRIQGRSSMKTSITRVGQHIIENFKNKEYLSLTDENGKDFEEFIKSVKVVKKSEDELVGNINGGEDSREPYKWEDEDITEDETHWEFSYKGVDYVVKTKLTGFSSADISNLELPNITDCEGVVGIDSNGILTISRGLGIDICNSGSSFTNPINNTQYTADCPTIILYDNFPGIDEGSLWIKNNDYYDSENHKQETIRIIRKFKDEKLNVYIEGRNSLNIERGIPGDGASYQQTSINRLLHVGENYEENKENLSELMIDIEMIISKAGDDTISDTFKFSFPVNYDYSE